MVRYARGVASISGIKSRLRREYGSFRGGGRCFPTRNYTRVHTHTTPSRGVTYPTENRVSIQKPKTISLRGSSVSSPARRARAAVALSRALHVVSASDSSVSIYKLFPRGA